MSRLFDLARRESEPKGVKEFFKEHSFTVFLWPAAWRDAQSTEPLHWTKVEFGRGTIEDVPEVRGVYAFAICIKKSIMPSHGVLVYFGETTRTLRERYREYIRDSERGAKRPKFEELFDLWAEDLKFFFAPIQNAVCNLKTIETALNDAVIPYCVTKDFSAEIRRIVPILRG